MNTIVPKVRALIRRLWAIPFCRYLVVGGTNTVLLYTVFAVLILFEVHYTVATLVAFICSILFSFKVQGTVNFRNKSNRPFSRFALLCITIYFVNIGLLRVLGTFDIGKLAAQAILTLPLAFASFIMMRKFVFRP